MKNPASRLGPRPPVGRDPGWRTVKSQQRAAKRAPRDDRREIRGEVSYAGARDAAERRPLGGARGRRLGAAGRRRWARMRSMWCGAVMNATIRIASPQRGQRNGSTSNRRRSNSAHRRLASRKAVGRWSPRTHGNSVADPSSPWAAWRRRPRARDAYQP